MAFWRESFEQGSKKYLADVNLLREFARGGAVRSEDSGAVAIWVTVDDFDGIVQRLGLHHAEHGAEDFLLVARHVWLQR